MSRPTTKQQLMDKGEDYFNELFDLINSLEADEQEKLFAFEDRDKNIRDVLVHLYEWHQLLLNWIKSNLSGKEINFLPEPYNWKTYPQMNIEFRDKHQTTSYRDATAILQKSHTELMGLIDTFTNEQLFTKKIFPWTATTSLGSYCVSATSSHYDWAMKKIKKHTKNLSTYS